MIPAPAKRDKSYDHAHHAGNAADVFKHVTLRGLHDAWAELCDGPVQWVDTHAAAGFYKIGGAGEWERGVVRATKAMRRPGSEAPDMVQAVLGAAPMTAFQSVSGEQTHYSGSSLLLSAWLNGEDALYCCERDEAVAAKLRSRMEREPRAQVISGDAWDTKGWADRLRRDQPVLMLIDPPYATMEDWSQAGELASWLVAGWQAPAAAVVWYPVKGRSRPASRRRSMSTGGAGDWWQVELIVDEHAPEKGSMSGSGMLLVTNEPGLVPKLSATAGAASWLGFAMGERAGWSSVVRSGRRQKGR
jgi:23S rRNA (adenine2030-N6)-methyltransferase